MPTPEMKQELERYNTLKAQTDAGGLEHIGTAMYAADMLAGNVCNILALCNAYAAELERTRATGRTGEVSTERVENACRIYDDISLSGVHACSLGMTYALQADDQFRATHAVDSIGGSGGVEAEEALRYLFQVGYNVGHSDAIMSRPYNGEAGKEYAIFETRIPEVLTLLAFCSQPSLAKPQEAISGEGLNAGDGFIWNGRDFLRVAPGMESFAMLAMEQTLSNEVLEEEALLIMQAGIFEIVDPTQPLDAGTALVLAYRALTKEARIIPRAGKQTKENTHG